MRLTVLLFCLSACVTAADEYRVYADNARPSRELLARIGRLQSDPAHANAAWRILRLGSGVPEAALRANTLAALKDGVRYLPTLVLADENGLYARVVGAVGTQEGRTFAQRLAAARSMKTAARRPEAARKHTGGGKAELYELLTRSAEIGGDADADAIAQLEDDMRRYLQRPGASPADRQRLTLDVLYPLALRRYALACQGAHTPESEALFLRAVDLLEEARDMDCDSETGRRAHEMREELRRARLKAARYD